MPYKDPEKAREAARRWAAANPEKRREARRRWASANHEKDLEARRLRYAANIEKEREKGREATRRWREANREKARAASRRWREANPERALASARETRRRWREANPAKERERSRRWREANPEKKRESDRRWAAANRERVIRRVRAWDAANPEKVRERKRRRYESIIKRYGSAQLGQLMISMSQTRRMCEMVKSKLGTPAMNAMAVPGDGGHSSPTEGFRPGGKHAGTKARETATIIPEKAPVHYEKLDRSPDLPLSVRLWARGIDTPDDAQRFMDALGRDAGSGAISLKLANAYQAMLKMKVGIWFQTVAQGRTFHLMPEPPSLDGPEIDGKIVTTKPSKK